MNCRKFVLRFISKTTAGKDQYVTLSYNSLPLNDRDKAYHFTYEEAKVYLANFVPGLLSIEPLDPNDPIGIIM